MVNPSFYDEADHCCHTGSRHSKPAVADWMAERLAAEAPHADP